MSRFPRLALVAVMAVAVLSLTAAPAHAAPPPVPGGCALQTFLIGAMSTCDPGTVNTHQVSMGCQLLFGFPYQAALVWGPEVPTSLPSIALCPPLHYGLVGTVHTR
ncbi:hypothetical protein [Rhodococcus sp. WAY2]|uniref:hypothetical protein n=1 Tax=Rhodococcus sp. WAY2 TaxID=2663121 RepID=UPI00131F5CFA|nr:hypothetical protein [Rhodococcus sp. WAY2]QHE73099.1 hypothetical protein GFS60_06750 [Rhodococcus sp. WAY2]